MPNITVPAAGGAMPARRQFLTALAGAPALAIPAIPALATPAAAIGADPDAPIVALVAQLTDARERMKPVLSRLGVAEQAFRARGLPKRPQRDEFKSQSPERAAAGEARRAAAAALWALPDPAIDEERYRREMRSWRRRVRYWKRKTGLAEAEAAETRIGAEEHRLRSELMDRPARTLAGLKAKALAWDGYDPDLAESIARDLRELAR